MVAGENYSFNGGKFPAFSIRFHKNLCPSQSQYLIEGKNSIKIALTAQDCKRRCVLVTK